MLFVTNLHAICFELFLECNFFLRKDKKYCNPKRSFYILILYLHRVFFTQDLKAENNTLFYLVAIVNSEFYRCM